MDQLVSLSSIQTVRKIVTMQDKLLLPTEPEQQLIKLLF